MSLHPTKYISAVAFILMLVSGHFSLAIADGRDATILILLQPNKASGKSWDLGKGADPMICLDHGCYTGRGFLAPAKFYKGKKAFLPAVQARACRNSLTCVYRKVFIPADTDYIQPIDHDGFKSDLMQNATAKIDDSCRLEDMKLQCSEGIFTSEYSMWIVPKAIADQAGKKALDYALFKSLYEARQQYKKTFITELRSRLPVAVRHFFHSVLEKPVLRQCASDPELMAEVLYISEIFDSQKRQSSSFIRGFIRTELKKTNHADTIYMSKKFWDFHDGIKRLEAYTAADKYKIVPHQKGLKLIIEPEATTLLIGGDVKSRAENALSTCFLSHRLAERKTF